MNAVSTSIAGMSDVRSTAVGALDVRSTLQDQHEPVADRFSAASAWIEMKMSALLARAFCARIGSG